MLDIANLWDKDNLFAKMSAQTEWVQAWYSTTKSYKDTLNPDISMQHYFEFHP